MFTIVSFNTQGQHHDLSNFIEAMIEKHDPEMLFLQEVRIDRQNEADTPLMLQKKFPSYYGYYSPVFDFSKDYGKGSLMTNSMQEGLYTLSKYPIDINYMDLPIIPGVDRRPRGLQYIEYKGLKISHIHMSKHKASRKIAIMGLPISDIIIGDYNMQYDEVYSYFGKDYTIAYQQSSYISYPTKNITLDHCSIRTGKILDITTIPVSRSDHHALVYTLHFPEFM